MKKYCIYIHKNKINNKVYVGQTCQKPEYRWQNGLKYIESPIFYAAIKKYGWDNFEHIILEDNLTIEEANEKEKYYINLYNSTDRDYGYNLSQGGENRQPSKETSEKISARLKREWSDGTRDREKQSQIMKDKWQDENYRKEMLIKLHQNHVISEDGKKRISEARKIYIAEHGTPTQGKGHTEKTKQKIREKMLGENNPMYGTHHTQEWKDMMSKKMGHKIKCIETQQVFNSCKEAAEWCHLKSSAGFSDYFAGRKKSCGKHPQTNEKLHWEKIEEN